MLETPSVLKCFVLQMHHTSKAVRRASQGLRTVAVLKHKMNYLM